MENAAAVRLRLRRFPIPILIPIRVRLAVSARSVLSTVAVCLRSISHQEPPRNFRLGALLRCLPSRDRVTSSVNW